MAIDMTQFYQVFFDESAEHLAEMEALLLALDLDNPDSEALNAVFRAAHSIKGSSGTFGFTDMSDATHSLESMLDKVRKGEVSMTPPMVDAALAAGDVLKNLLAAHRGEGVADHEAARAVQARLEDICARLTADSAGAVAGVVGPSEVGQPPLSDPAGSCFDVSFMPDSQVAREPGALVELMAGMEGIESIEILSQTLEGGPWCLRIHSTLREDLLFGLVDFVAVSGSIQIAPAGRAGVATEGRPQAPVIRAPFPGALAPVPDPGADAGLWGLFEPLATGPPGGVDPASLESGAACGEANAGGVDASAEGGARAVAAGDPAFLEDAPDGSFGFFAPLAAPAGSGAAAQPRAVASPASAPQPAPLLVPAETQGRPDRGSAKAGGVDSSIRVGVDKVDQMINLVGELVITQAMLQQAASHVDPVLFEHLMDGLGQLERTTRDLQASVLSIRMLPISAVFSRFPRVVRDLSQKLGKKVELKTLGEDTELDKGVIERIADPLTHLVRNSLDHGIETPEKRRRAGKPEVGTITLKAFHQGGHVVIEVSDDGGGLDRGRILSKARERGFAVSESMTDGALWPLIFEPGFSTAELVSDVSGRGVGLDVVKKNISAMGGRVDIETVQGIGTRMTVRLPLTLAIVDGMSIAVGDEVFVLPLNDIIEALQPEPGQIRTLAGSERLIQVRDEYLPVVSLHQLFGCQGPVTDYAMGIVVVVEAEGRRAALLVDALLGQHQVVIKSLEANFRRVAGISGATIMGDGKVALIVDVAGTIAMARNYRSAA